MSTGYQKDLTSQDRSRVVLVGGGELEEHEGKKEREE